MSSSRTTGPPCDVCERPLSKVSRQILNIPENLILRCPARLDSPRQTWTEFSYPVSLQERILVDEMCVCGYPAEYTLVGVCLDVGFNHSPRAMRGIEVGHCVAAVRAPGGKIVVIDNTTIDEYENWADIEALQHNPTADDSKLLPTILVYRLSNRYTFTDPDWPLLSKKPAQQSPLTAVQIRDGLRDRDFGTQEDPTQRKLRGHERIAQDLVEYFPNLSLSRILDTYKDSFGSIQVTVDTLLKNEVPEPYTLDALTAGRRHELLPWCVRFPHLSVADISAIVDMRSDQIIYRELGSTARISTRSQQDIGKACVQTELELLRNKYIRGKCTYMTVNGDRYVGKFNGRLELISDPNITSSPT